MTPFSLFKRSFPLLVLLYSLSFYNTDLLARGGGDFRGGGFGGDFDRGDEMRAPDVNRDVNRDINRPNYNMERRAIAPDYRNPAARDVYNNRNLETQEDYMMESNALESSVNSANQPMIIQQPQQQSQQGSSGQGGFNQGSGTYNPD